MYLASGESLSMRLWEEHPGEPAEATAREYETVGYVIKGRAELESEGDNGSEEAARTRALLDAYHRPGRPLTRARRRIP